MSQTTSRVVLIIEKCYQCISNSFYFWGLVLSRGIVYGWSTAMRRTLFRRENQSEQENIESPKKGLPFEHVLSVLLTCGLSLFWLSQLFDTSSRLTSLLAAIGTTLSALSFLVMVYYSLEAEKAQSSVESFYLAIKNILIQPFFTFFLISLLVLASLLWVINPILFFAVLPGTAIEFIYQGIQRMSR